MAIFSSQFATIGVLIAQHPDMPGGPIPVHHAPVALGTATVIFIVILAVLIAAFAQVARELTSLYVQLVKVFAAVTSVLFSIVLIGGVSVALLIRR